MKLWKNFNYFENTTHSAYVKNLSIFVVFFYFLDKLRVTVKYEFHSPMDGSDEFLVPSADIDRACPGDRPYRSLYFSCWLASIDLDLNLDLLNRVLMAPKKSRFFFLLRPRSPEKHSEPIWIEQQCYCFVQELPDRSYSEKNSCPNNYISMLVIVK